MFSEAIINGVSCVPVVLSSRSAPASSNVVMTSGLELERAATTNGEPISIFAPSRISSLTILALAFNWRRRVGESILFFHGIIRIFLSSSLLFHFRRVWREFEDCFK